MNLYVWLSSGLKDYSHGTIAVMADTVDEAREKVRKEAHDWAMDRYFSWFEDPDDPQLQVADLCEDDQERYRDIMSEFEADIAVEPAVADHGVLLVGGGA